ncbi:hypothetical protein VDG07_12780 [Xanthomonas campestris pv. raphani]|uniref:hypothetical protein n=1 Tax=Xanthomonas campestris TaxID=339 RepID=UPI002B237C63|nr:hypothetical protein [Xanthomonas campestris]MEA9796207.1 hypothetical protein [Xanthomonas campestris pv. raphani]
MEGVVGAENHIEVVFQFAAWALSRKSPPTNADARTRWGMSRSTAWRYLRAMRNAGLQPGGTP